MKLASVVSTFVAAGALVLAVAAGCSSPKFMPPPGCSTDTSAIQSKILGPKCATAGCHSGSTPTANLDLGSPGVEGRLVGVPSSDCQNKTLVVAGDPDTSYFIEKLGATPACGQQMPFGQAALASSDVQCLKAWVASLTSSSADGGGGDGSSGVDGGTTCTAPLVSCNGTCVDTQTDGQNCGKCGTKCPIACSAGACVTMCPSNTMLCGSSCVDTKTDANNCGGCGKVCSNGQICSAGACSCGTAVSFASQVQPIFTASCAGMMCHGGVMPPQGLDLRTGKSYALLVNHPAGECSNRMRVIPKDVTNSYLWSKLVGVNMCFGSQMPKMGGLAKSDQDTIRSWICSGALNN